MDNYSISLAWSDEDGGYVASVPEFENLAAFGETAEEALTEALVAIDLHVETLADEGLIPPKPLKRPTFSGQLRLRMPRWLHQALAHAADREGVSLNTFIVCRLSHNYALHTTAEIQRTAYVTASRLALLQSLSSSATAAFGSQRHETPRFEQRGDAARYFEASVAPSSHSWSVQ